MPRRQFVATILTTIMQNYPARFVVDIPDDLELTPTWAHEQATELADTAKKDGFLIVPHNSPRKDAPNLPAGGIVIARDHIGAIIYGVEYMPNAEGGNA